MDTSRRVFVKFAAMFSAAATLAPGEVEAGTREATAPGSITELLRHPDSARRIGATYLQQHGDAALRQIDLRSIVGTASPAATRDNRREHLKVIRTRIRRDFAEGRTVNVDGWILSETEVALCVVAALQHQP